MRWLASGYALALGCLSLLGFLGLPGCRPASHPERDATGPRHVVLLTTQGLRSDVVGSLDGKSNPLTPQLDAFFAAASASGTAISPSSDTAPALASVLTGLSPWEHQTLSGEAPNPSRRLYTVAECLRDRGFATTAILDGKLLPKNPGFLQGFQSSFGLRRKARVRSHLARLSGEPTFTWIHLAQPQPPYFFGAPGRGARRDRLLLAEMEPYRNPASPLPQPLRNRFWQGYLRHVSWLDREVGGILEALRSSGQWDDTLIVFVSLHGEEFGEQGQIGHGNNLGRAALEVPWALKLPASQESAVLQIPERPAVGRLVATLLAATGAPRPPALAPPLFEADSGGALSELYLGNGVNQFSLLDGDLQLLRTVRFVRPERRYYLARRQLLGDPRAGGSKAEAQALFKRLRSAFDGTPPFSGPFPSPDSAVRTELFRWRDGGVTPVEDPALERRMSEALERRWSRFLDRERTPRGERDFWRGTTPPPPRANGSEQEN